MKRINKKGSHIDVILSFVIFIGFMIFLYAMMQPNITAAGGKTAFLNYIGNELIKNLSGNDLIGISTRISYNGEEQDCLQLQDFLSNLNIGPGIIVKNLTGQGFSDSYSGNILYIDASPDTKLTYLFDIYSSSSFSTNESAPFPCKDLALDRVPNGYFIEGIENYSSYGYVWEYNIIQLINSYNNNYNQIKDWFNLTATQNFRFDFTYQNQTVIGTVDNIPVSINVYSEIFPVVYLSENRNLEAGNLIVRVW